MRRTLVRAPGKLNLGLRIVGHRPDGYHVLESLFVPLSLADDLAIELGGPPGTRLRVRGDAAAGVPADEGNLAWGAAVAFREAAGLREGVSLDLEKRIPSPAGLGGGSSDAGAVLRGLAELRPGAVPAQRLAEIALQLGADVPFFVAPRAALVEGIGERITPVLGVPSLPLLLVHPGVGLETRAVYAAYDSAPALTRLERAPTLRALLALREEAGAARARWPSSEERLRELIVNDLEPAASTLCPLVAKVREELTATGARAVGMSGSGPTMYAIYGNAADARRAQGQVSHPGRRTWLTQTLVNGANQIQGTRSEKATD